MAATKAKRIEGERKEIPCQCVEECGNAIKVPKATQERIEAMGDLLISLACPNIERYEALTIEPLDGFLVVSALFLVVSALEEASRH